MNKMKKIMMFASAVSMLFSVSAYAKPSKELTVEAASSISIENSRSVNASNQRYQVVQRVVHKSCRYKQTCK
jgi:hypothetical protein